MLFLIEYEKDMNKIQYFFDLDKYYSQKRYYELYFFNLLFELILL